MLTSNYYHAVRGGFVEVSTKTQSLCVRGAYLERPSFRSQGFIDQEMGGFLSVGTKLSGNTQHGLAAYVGGGQMRGVMRRENPRPTDTVNRRNFRQNGPFFTLQYELNWKALHLSAAQNLFVGFGAKDQTDAYVAWPYNMFVITFGAKI